MRVVYAHHEPLTFTDYIDLETGQTLRAVPGGLYDIAPASGRVIPEFPAPWFTRAGDGEPDLWSAADESAPEGGAEDGPAPEDEQHPEEG